MAQFVLPSKSDPIPPGQGGDGDFELVPEFEKLPVEVVEVVEREKDAQFRFDDDDLTEISFRFKVTEGKFAKRQFFATTKPIFNWGDKCHLRHYIEAILGVPKDGLPEGYEVNLHELKGHKCQIVIGHRVPKSGKNAGKTVEKVLQVLPAAPTTSAASVFGS